MVFVLEVLVWDLGFFWLLVLAGFFWLLFVCFVAFLVVCF